MSPYFCWVTFQPSLFILLQIPHEEAPAKKLRLSKPSKSAALHVDLCKATNSTEALQYLLQFARKPVEAESVEGVIRILLEHYYKVTESRSFALLCDDKNIKPPDFLFQETDSAVRLKIASLLGLLSKTNGFSPDCIVDDAINTLSNESKRLTVTFYSLRDSKYDGVLGPHNDIF